MLLTRDIWLTLSPEKRLKNMEEALTQLKSIAGKTSPLKDKISQGRLAGARRDLEKFVIDAVAWESDRQIHRQY